MSDLQNDFPSWGETGTLPAGGFFYQGGDQVNEKHLDALWHNVKTHFDLTHTAIRDRVREIEGDTILDGGLVASTTANAREISVSASNAGAYVDGQRTGSIASATVTLSTNGTTSTRTDSIWVDTTGQIGKTEGTTSVSDGQTKIAEVDVASDDTISAVRNTGRDRIRSFASENPDAGQIPGGFQPGDIWYDITNDKLNGRINGAWRPLLPADGSQPLIGSFNVNGNNLTNINSLSGDGSLNTWEIRTGGADIGIEDNTNNIRIIDFLEGGNVDLPNGDLTAGATTIWDSVNGYVPASSVEDVWVNAAGDSMSGNLLMGGNNVQNANLIRFRDVGGDGDQWQIAEEGNGRLKITLQGLADSAEFGGNGDLYLAGSVTENASI